MSFKIGDIVAYKRAKYTDIYIGVVVDVKKSGNPIIQPCDGSEEISTQCTKVNVTEALKRVNLKIEILDYDRKRIQEGEATQL